MKNRRIEAIRNIFSLFDIQDHTLTLAEFERSSSYCRFDASTRYVMAVLEKAGFSRVERLTHKADGKTAALDCIMPQAWDQCGHSFLRITSPDIPEYERMLSDSDRHPQEAVIWSAPTPEGGISLRYEKRRLRADFPKGLIAVCRGREYDSGFELTI